MIPLAEGNVCYNECMNSLSGKTIKARDKAHLREIVDEIIADAQMASNMRSFPPGKWNDEDTKCPKLDTLFPNIKARKEPVVRIYDLNHIDISAVTDMSGLFNYLDNFNADMSRWDVSHVTNMSYMFSECQFEGDISNWDTSKVKTMRGMFENSTFQGDISGWSFASLEDKQDMFSQYHESPFGLDCMGWAYDNAGNRTQMPGPSEVQRILDATTHIVDLRESMKVRWEIFQNYQHFERGTGLLGDTLAETVNSLSNDPIEKALLYYQMKGQRPTVEVVGTNHLFDATNEHGRSIQ